MMKLSLSLALICSLLSAPVFAKDTAKTPMDPKEAEMMKKWKEASTPGEPHKIFEKMAGSWKYTSQWWKSPKAEPMKSNGSSTFTLILGKRFLQHKTTGKAMGQPFEGLGITGYDNIKGKYDSLWLDNMGTGVMHGTGTFDATTQTLKDSGTFSCPMTGDKEREYRSEWKVTDKNNMTYTMWGPDEDDNEFKQMELVYTRR